MHKDVRRPCRILALLVLLLLLLLRLPVQAEQTHEPITMLTGMIDYTLFIELLEQTYPEVNLQMISYRGGNTSGYMHKTLEEGDIPDIYTNNYLESDALQQEHLLDLAGYDFINNYSDAMLSDVAVDGAVYLLPSRFTICGINYNKTLFEQYGWTVPASFEELVALAAQIEQDAPDIIPVTSSMNLKGYPFAYFFAVGNTMFFDTPAGARWKKDFLAGTANAVGTLEECAAYYKKWIDAGFINTDYINSDPNVLLQSGKTAIMLTLTTAKWESVNEETGETISIGIMPWLGEGDNDNVLISNVARYYGLSKALGETGNEQKLEDALKVLSLMASVEGQTALSAGTQNGVYYPLKDFTVTETNPLYEVSEEIEAGYTVPLVYGGWEDLIVPMADEMIRFIDGEIDADTMLARFDAIRDEALCNPDIGAYAVADEPLTCEQAARLSGLAMIDMLEADAALVSLGGIVYDISVENGTGVNAPIYAGAITEEVINMFCPWGYSTVTIELTGAEIAEQMENGRGYEKEWTLEDGTKETQTYWFPYVLTVKGDEALVPEQTYTVALNAKDYSTTQGWQWGERLIAHTETTGDAIKAWLQALDDGHLSAADLAVRESCDLSLKN